MLQAHCKPRLCWTSQRNWSTPYVYLRAHSTLQPAAGAASSAGTTAASVQPISGAPSPLDPSTGFVPREGNPKEVQAAFSDLLASLVSAYQAACGSRLVGVFLRGSLPRGLFIPGISDVDTFALLLPLTAGSSGSDGSGSDSSEDSSSSSLHDLQQVVKRLSEPAVQAHQHLGYTKVEVKVMQLQPGSPAVAAIQTLLQQHEQQQQQSTNSALHQSAPTSPSSSSGSHSIPSLLRPSMVASIPQAFELATASVCLAGLDLTQLLPPNAALAPQYEVLPGLMESVEAARLAVGAAAVTAEVNHSSNAAATGTPAAAAAGVAAGEAGYGEGTVPPELEAQVRATKWALKRLLRGAFELVQDRAGCYTRDLYWCCEAAKQHLPLLQQQLTWAHGATQQQHSQLMDQLDDALQLYVSLQAGLLELQQQQQQQQQEQQQEASGTDAAAAAAAPAAAASQQHLQQLVRSSWQLVDGLLPPLEAAFLKLMLAEEPGWLTHHQGRPIPARPEPTHLADSSSSSSNSAKVAGRTSGNGSSSDNSGSTAVAGEAARAGEQGNQQSPWLFAGKALAALQAVLSPAVLGASSSSPAAPHIAQLMGAAPPCVQVHVAGQLQALDWQDPQGRAAAASAVRQILSPQQGATDALTARQQLHSTACSSRASGSNKSSVSSSNGAHVPAAAAAELFGCWPQPVLLRGAASSWPCCQQGGWGLDWLAAQQGLQGKVRVAPSLHFPFVEPQLLDILLQLRGVQAAPSILTAMSVPEFVQRLQPGCPLPAVAYAPSEHYYLQAELPQHLQHQPQLEELLQALSVQASPAAAAGEGGDDHQQQQQQQQQQFVMTQLPRLWVSPAGAVSPLHYDKSHSFLVQVTGCKRMLFFSPDQLHRLYCYADTHLLRRRSRVNLSAPDLGKFPLFAGVAALEVLLRPGDIVCFPSHWSHYTESLGQGQPAAAGGSDRLEPLGCSMSITFRCKAAV